MSPFDWVLSKRRWHKPPHAGRSAVIHRGPPGKGLTNRPSIFVEIVDCNQKAGARIEIAIQPKIVLENS